MKGRFLWPWSKPKLVPSHMDVAKQDLEAARLDLLKMEKEREAAAGWVTTLKNRVLRLEAYIQEEQK